MTAAAATCTTFHMLPGAFALIRASTNTPASTEQHPGAINTKRKLSRAPFYDFLITSLLLIAVVFLLLHKERLSIFMTVIIPLPSRRLTWIMLQTSSFEMRCNDSFVDFPYRFKWRAGKVCFSTGLLEPYHGSEVTFDPCLCAAKLSRRDQTTWSSDLCALAASGPGFGSVLQPKRWSSSAARAA